MKNTLIFLFTFFITIASAQSPLFYGYGNLGSKTAIGGGIYDVTITNFTGGYKMYPDANYDASDISASPANMVLWAGCVRFVVTQKTSSSPLILRVSDVSGTGALDGNDLNGYRLTLGQESSVNSRNIGYFSNIADGNSGSQAGISPFDAACIENYYRVQLDTLISEVAAPSFNGIFSAENDADTAMIDTVRLTQKLRFVAMGVEGGLTQIPGGENATGGGISQNGMAIWTQKDKSFIGKQDSGTGYVEADTLGNVDIQAQKIIIWNTPLFSNTGSGLYLVDGNGDDSLGLFIPQVLDLSYDIILPDTTTSENGMFMMFNAVGGNAVGRFATKQEAADTIANYITLPNGLFRYDAGNGAIVTATGLGITFVRTTSSIWTLTIPENVEPVGKTTINNSAAESATAALTVNIVFQGTRIYNQDASDNMTDLFAPTISTVEKTIPAQYPSAAAANNPSWTLDVTSAGTLSLNTTEFTEVGNGGANATSILLDF